MMAGVGCWLRLHVILLSAARVAASAAAAPLSQGQPTVVTSMQAFHFGIILHFYCKFLVLKNDRAAVVMADKNLTWKKKSTVVHFGDLQGEILL